MADNERNEAVVVEEEEKKDDLLDKFSEPSDNKRKIRKHSPVKVMVIALVAVCVLVGGIFLLTRPNSDDKNDGSTSSLSIGDSSSNPLVDDNKMWQADVKKNKKGKIKNEGAGQLLELIPYDIKEIEIEHPNEKFTITSETPVVKTDETDPDTGKKVEKTEATIYTIVGYEDFELRGGVADEIANICSTLEYTSIAAADAGDKLDDYGLKNPRATANITFDDNTKAVIKVGDDIVQGRGTYVMFGTGKEVFVCDSERIEPLLTSLTGMISLKVNEAASDTDNNEFKSLTLSGTNFDSAITIKPNPDTDSVFNDYMLTAPVSTLASNDGVSQVSGAIRGLDADEVAYLNPDSSALEKLGLDSPYAKVVAEYPDTTVILLASKPDGEGNVNFMKEGDKVVYTKASAALPWVTTDLKALTSEYVLCPELSGLKEMKVSLGGKDYSFKIKTVVSKATDEYDEETSTTETTTTYKGKELTQGNFETYFSNASLITKADYSASSPSGNAAITVRYSYSGSRQSDTVAFYNIDGNKYTATLNGKPVGTVYASYVETLVSQTPAVAKDNQINSVW